MQPRSFTLKNRCVLEIREATAVDARAVLDYVEALSNCNFFNVIGGEAHSTNYPLELTTSAARPSGEGFLIPRGSGVFEWVNAWAWASE